MFDLILLASPHQNRLLALHRLSHCCHVTATAAASVVEASIVIVAAATTVEVSVVATVAG